MATRRLQLVEAAKGTPNAEGGSVPRLRVAIATQDMSTLNAHFGSARKFAIYEVTPDESRLVCASAFDEVSDENGKHRSEGADRVAPKLEALSGCHLLFCLAIGGPSAARVVSAGIHPVRLPAPEPIESVLAKVQKMMIASPPPWLRKVMGLGTPRSMVFLDEDD